MHTIGMKRAFLMLFALIVLACSLVAAEPQVSFAYYNNPGMFPFAAAFQPNVMVMIQPGDPAVEAYKVTLFYKDIAGQDQAKQAIVAPQPNGYAFAFLYPGAGATGLIVSVSALRAAETVVARPT